MCRIHSFRLQFSIRAVCLVTILSALLAKFAGPTAVSHISQWFVDERTVETAFILSLGHPLGNIPSVDGVRISELDTYGVVAIRSIDVTNTADITAVTEAVSACIKVRGYNLCMEPAYRIELLSGKDTVLTICPTACCGIFTVPAGIYEDDDRELRDLVATIFRRGSSVRK